MATPLNFPGYVLLCVRRAFSTSVGSGNNWSWFVGQILVGAASAFGLSKVIRIDQLSGLQISILDFVAAVLFFFLMRLFIWAPYQLWKEERTQVLALGRTTDGLPLAAFVHMRDSFTLAESACLLAGQPISNDQISGVASGFLSDLKMRVADGQFIPVGMSRPDEKMLLARAVLTGKFKTSVDEIPQHYRLAKPDLCSIAQRYGVVIPGLG
jgi:hypothetical protein